MQHEHLLQKVSSVAKMALQAEFLQIKFFVGKPSCEFSAEDENRIRQSPFFDCFLEPWLLKNVESLDDVLFRSRYLFPLDLINFCGYALHFDGMVCILSFSKLEWTADFSSYVLHFVRMVCFLSLPKLESTSSLFGKDWGKSWRLSGLLEVWRQHLSSGLLTALDEVFGPTNIFQYKT